MKSGKYVVLLAMLSVMLSAVGSYAAGLDQNEEVQSVMGDLSALKTAAQMYYGDSGNDASIPPLSSVLSYFDEGTLPPDAASLYAIDGRGGNWYVGYKAYGLRNDTYRLLEENANSLNLVGDDLLSPWARGNGYIWSSALTVRSSSGGPVIRESRTSDTAAGVATVLLGTAIFLNIIDHHRRDHHYSYPQQPWHWRSALRYHPRHRDRFYRDFSRPRQQPRFNHRPVPRHREPQRWRPDPRRGQRPQRPQFRRPPERNRAERRQPGGNRRPDNNRRPGGNRRPSNNRQPDGNRPRFRR